MRDAVEAGWPQPLELEEHSHAGMAERWRAGAAGLPFGVLRGYVGTDLAAKTETIATIACPFSGDELTAVPALNPDVGIIHAQQADAQGNVMLWGITGVQKECVLASKRTIVTVEEQVNSFSPRTNGVVLPAWVIDVVSVVPGGAHPSYAHDYSQRDNQFYADWDEVSRDRGRFRAWLDRLISEVVA
jgi:glutaconate CoA-transferase subunit A